MPFVPTSAALIIPALTMPTPTEALTAAKPHMSPHSFQVELDYGSKGKVMYDFRKDEGQNRLALTKFRDSDWKVRIGLIEVCVRVMSACDIVKIQSKPQPTRTKSEPRSAAQAAKKIIAQGIATSRKASSWESKRPAQVWLPLPAVNHRCCGSIACAGLNNAI